MYDSLNYTLDRIETTKKLANNAKLTIEKLVSDEKFKNSSELLLIDFKQFDTILDAEVARLLAFEALFDEKATENDLEILNHKKFKDFNIYAINIMIEIVNSLMQKIIEDANILLNGETDEPDFKINHIGTPRIYLKTMIFIKIIIFIRA